jgi:hypothetical protein
MARLILNPGTPFAREMDLRGGKITLGRSADNDIQINDATISSRHCEVDISDIAISVKDLGSRNGSFVNGERIQKATLQSGQLLRLGQVEMRFDLGDVNIAIPKQELAPEQTSILLEDGAVSCLNHLDVAGTLQCSQCGRIFCESCVRSLSRISGGVLRFCPICSNAQCCEIAKSKGEGPKGGLMGWLQNTLQITKKKKRR